ncbi:Low temperature requirement protein LtrA [Microlunatus sagamiharensis]|uniref:Low temperature requirement protein LtrA n=1 Tax=Microlunatus sagamiharensis TaxID=546874 RepID=A0A1H2MVC8_9ACTN|nr:low temperature requirement protein A [Microlunatus sagamiharensis]SDU97179.1 Low temperature requirement protein LtrA [Microlunatus sagamiharensis]
MSAPAVTARLVRPLRPRDPDEQGRVASELELLTDLCFVVAVAQAAAALHHGLVAGLVGPAVLGYAMAFFAIWWAWLNFSWFSSAYDNDDVGYRLLTILQIVGVLTLAAGIMTLAEGVEEREGHFGLVVVGYVVMRVGLVLQWLRAARNDPARRRTCLRYALGIVVVQLGWVAFYLASHVPGLVVPLFAALVACELLVPAWAERTGETSWHPHHIAERYGLFFIIVLGETILSATLAVQEAFTGETEHRVAVAGVTLGGVLVVFSLWWLYFSREAAEVLERARRDGTHAQYLFGFGHYVIYAAAAGVGAGLAARTEAVAHPEGRHLDLVTSAAVTVPVAVLLLAMWVVHLRLHDRSWRTAVPFVGAAALVLASTPLPVSELVTGAVLAALVVVETRLAARRASAG